MGSGSVFRSGDSFVVSLDPGELEDAGVLVEEDGERKLASDNIQVFKNYDPDKKEWGIQARRRD